ncbi:transposase [Alcanivorax sp. S71-1-4]|uniref:transposase n=1 Tax=Alcanivorax sp. S71-1-4 TaxID=1177159 RepID=UPI00135746CF
MPRYSDERKATILNRLLPPENLSGQEGVSEATLYNWRNRAREGECLCREVVSNRMTGHRKRSWPR